MAFVQIFSPQSESEVIVVRSLLEAHDIPVFVHGRHFGSLLPGLQFGNANMQSIMVPEERAKDALELLSGFRRDDCQVSHRDDHDA
ncbi:MAG: putative signal transducing protein [Steroidobacteraceae bacterium]